jgi:hypothetical protein
VTIAFIIVITSSWITLRGTIAATDDPNSCFGTWRKLIASWLKRGRINLPFTWSFFVGRGGFMLSRGWATFVKGRNMEIFPLYSIVIRLIKFNARAFLIQAET